MKKYLFLFLVIVSTTIIFSSCTKKEDDTPNFIVENLGNKRAEIYVDGNLLSVVYEKTTEEFVIPKGEHTIYSKFPTTGQISETKTINFLDGKISKYTWRIY